MDYIKRNFVNKYLSSTITKIREDIAYCEYIQETNKEEYVIIVFIDGSTERICVSARSNLCIMRDVAEHLLYH